MTKEGRSLPPAPASWPGGCQFLHPQQVRGQALHYTSPHTLLSSPMSRCPPPSQVLAVTQTRHTTPRGPEDLVLNSTMLGTCVDNTKTHSHVCTKGTGADAHISFRGFLIHQDVQKTPSIHLLQALTGDVERAKINLLNPSK